MGTHTPGPWEAHLNLDFGSAQISSFSTGRPVVADVLGSRTISGRCFADARLIAAAPELLEALSNLLDALEAADVILPKDDPDPVVTAARAAIAKARGQ